MQDPLQLPVWRKAHQPDLRTDAPTEAFPKCEPFGINRRRRRAATSITAHFAEGRGRGSDADLARFAFMAMGSACGLGSHGDLAKALVLRPLPDLRFEVDRMPAALIDTPSPDGRQLKADG